MNSPTQFIYLDKSWLEMREWLTAKSYSSYYILCDENTYKRCLPVLESKNIFKTENVIQINSGEEYKTLESVEFICTMLLDKGIDRNSLCIALGGGMICDLMGFCASIILRGVDCIYIPTSLLAMSDASIGGKTGVNFNGWKNQLGTFKDPKLVAFDFHFLETLDSRNLKNGFVEMIKHSLLMGKSEFDEIKKIGLNNFEDALFDQIKNSVDYKLKIVAEDWLEKGVRKNLNLGHTLGHAIESFVLSKGIDILHGEAIALGLVYELKIAGIIYHEDEEYFNSEINYILSYGFDFKFNSNDINEIINNLQGDKKKWKNKILFCLLKVVGECRIDVEVDEKLITKILSTELPEIVPC